MKSLIKNVLRKGCVKNYKLYHPLKAHQLCNLIDPLFILTGVRSHLEKP